VSAGACILGIGVAPLPAEERMRGRQALKMVLRALGVDVTRRSIYRSVESFVPYLLSSLRVNCVIDVGAHHGEYGMMLRRSGFLGKIVSFEPVSESIRLLSEKARHDPDWIVLPVALGDRSGRLSINVPKYTDLASFYLPRDELVDWFGKDGMANVIEEVEVRRLDELFDALVAPVVSPRVYLKIDTQGWDLNVFRGASGCLNRILAVQSEVYLRPQYEAMPPYPELMEAFRQEGFEPAFIEPLRRDLSGLILINIDFVCVRGDVL
jgi:FkbM family methyltransferase